MQNLCCQGLAFAYSHRPHGDHGGVVKRPELSHNGCGDWTIPQHRDDRVACAGNLGEISDFFGSQSEQWLNAFSASVPSVHGYALAQTPLSDGFPEEPSTENRHRLHGSSKDEGLVQLNVMELVQRIANHLWL